MTFFVPNKVWITQLMLIQFAQDTIEWVELLSHTIYGAMPKVICVGKVRRPNGKMCT